MKANTYYRIHTYTYGQNGWLMTEMKYAPERSLSYMDNLLKKCFLITSLRPTGWVDKKGPIQRQFHPSKPERFPFTCLTIVYWFLTIAQTFCNHLFLFLIRFSQISWKFNGRTANGLGLLKIFNKSFNKKLLFTHT